MCGRDGDRYDSRSDPVHGGSDRTIWVQSATYPGLADNNGTKEGGIGGECGEFTSASVRSAEADASISVEQCTAWRLCAICGMLCGREVCFRRCLCEGSGGDGGREFAGTCWVCGILGESEGVCRIACLLKKKKWSQLHNTTTTALSLCRHTWRLILQCDLDRTIEHFLETILRLRTALHVAVGVDALRQLLRLHLTQP